MAKVRAKSDSVGKEYIGYRTQENTGFPHARVKSRVSRNHSLGSFQALAPAPDHLCQVSLWSRTQN